MTNKKSLHSTTLFFITLLILTLMPIYTATKTQAQIYPVISLVPSEIHAEPGEYFNVSLIVSDVERLYVYQVYIRYSNEILYTNESSIIEGTFLSRGSYDTFFQPKVSNYTGYSDIMVWGGLYHPAPEASGTGELFRITFKVINPGGCKLDIHDTMLIDKYQAQIYHESKDGIFATVNLKLEPEEILGAEYGINGIFQLNLTLEGKIINFYGFEAEITYDSNVINATEVTLQPLLNKPYLNYTTLEEGKIYVNVTCQSPAAPKNETGILATITFKILSMGETEINITKSKLINYEREEIVHLKKSAIFIMGVLRNIAITDGWLSSYEEVAGANLTLTLIIKNVAPFNESFNVMIYAVDNFSAIIGVFPNMIVPADTEQQFNFTVSTKGLSGNYTVIAQISYVPYEINLTDNRYQLSTKLLIKPPPQEVSIPWHIIILVVVLAVVIIAVVAFKKYRKK